MIPVDGVLGEGREALDAFYALVARRDEVFVRNMEKTLNAEDQKAAVLITGGYHTPNLKRLLQEKGYSYSVLTPVVTQETNQKKYESLLLSQNGKTKKQIQLTEGQSGQDDRPLSTLDGDLAKLIKKKTQQLRQMLAAARLSNGPEGASMSALIEAAAVYLRVDPGKLKQEAFGGRLASVTPSVVASVRSPQNAAYVAKRSEPASFGARLRPAPQQFAGKAAKTIAGPVLRSSAKQSAGGARLAEFARNGGAEAGHRPAAGGQRGFDGL
jgi:hypothetical protein